MKTLKIVAIIIIVLILIPILSWIFWNFKSSTPLNILIINKTVLDLGRKEHKSFFWLLNNEKYMNDQKRSYKVRRDYFGFHPQKPLKDRKYEVNRIKLTEIDQLSEKYDVAYYMDTYGVFFNEWYEREIKGRGTLIEGGLTNSDYVFLSKMHEKNKLILAEYNFLANPTDGLVRKKTEDLLGFHWTGWIGRYVNQLNPKRSDELPEWVIDIYKANHKGEWPFSGSGIVLLNEGRKTVLVLESDVHLDEIKVPELQATELGIEKYQLPETVHFPNWFDITENDSNQVLAEFKIHINMEGKTILDQYNLPSRFPAILSSGNSSPFYYFAGDFSKYDVTLCTARLAGIGAFKGLFYGNKKSSMAKCYWTFYVPIVSQILEEYQLSME